MVDARQLSVALLGLVSSAPLIIAYLIGVAFALLRWSRHPRVSLLVFFGCGLLLFQLIMLGTIASLLPNILMQRDWKPSDIASAFAVINQMRSVISAIGVSLLLFAAFARRAD